MSTEGAAQAREVVKGYMPSAAAPMVLWGVLLTIATPLPVALAWATGNSGNPFLGTPASPNPLFMLLAVVAGIAAAALLITGCWRAARNGDYVAAVAYLQAENLKRESTEVGTSPH